MSQKEKKVAHCHFMIADVAKAAAGEMYQKLMEDNFLYDCWKKSHPGMGSKALEKAFIEKNWGRCIPMARATLTLMLKGPLDEKSKEQILDALVKDATLMRGRAEPYTQLG